MERLIALVAPHRCLVCGVEGAVICAWCLPDCAPSLPDRCYRCRAQTTQSLVCGRCRRQTPIRHVWVRTSYEAIAKQLVHDFKFERKRAVVRSISQLAAEALPHLPADTVVTHVPTATSRVRSRGYDHAYLIARELAGMRGLRYTPLLTRVGQARQVGTKRAERLRQLGDAFRYSSPESVPKRVLLVDDLVTTGATLAAAGRELKRHGCKVLDAVVFAQKE